jgi:5'-3' exonuclease
MGVRLLNTFIRKRGSKSGGLDKQHLSSLNGKTIAVDAMIYMYRFKGEGNLIESFYTLILLCLKYSINAYFVFDGKEVSEEKNQERSERKVKKRQTGEKIIHLEEKIAELESSKKLTPDEQSLKAKLENDIKASKKNCVYIKNRDIRHVKKLVELCGFPVINAEGEADEFCAILSKRKKVDAVLTEDMDLFAYGCVNVMRYLSLVHHTFVMYNIDKIMCSLKIDFPTFRSLCVLSGTDYNPNYKKRQDTNIFNVYRQVGMYYRTKHDNLYDYICNKKCDVDALKNVEKMFIIDSTSDKVTEMKYNQEQFMCDELKIFLQKYNFF